MLNYEEIMDYKLSRLKNGLRVLTVSLPNLESATVTAWVRTGSRNESNKVSGLSHFLEHMAFKGGKKYASAKEVSETIDRIGGEFNASTSKEWTQFYVRTRSKLMPLAFDVLADIVLNASLRNDDIEREKGVILEEINMYEDTPTRKIWDLFEQVVFERHVLGRDTIGSKKTNLALQKKDFVSYRKKHYYAKNMLITVSGGVRVKDVVKLAQQFFGRMKVKGEGKIKKKRPLYKKPKVKLKSKKIEQAHIIIGFPADPLGFADRYVDSTLDTLMGGGMSSRLFTEVREKRGLAYSVKSEMDRFLDAGYFAAYAGVDPKKALETVKVILDQFYGLAEKRFPLEEIELSKAKEYLKGHLALSLEDTRGVNMFFGYEQLMLDKTRTPEDVYSQVNKVSIDDIYRQAKRIFDPKKLKLAVIGPYKDQAKFEKLLV